MAVVGKLGDFVVADRDVWVRLQGGRDGFCEGLAINSQCATGGDAVFFSDAHDQAVGLAHLPMQQTDGVLLIIVRTE